MLLNVQNLSIDYTRNNTAVHAVRDVTLNLAEGETLGIVGESGCGKSTLAMAFLRLLPERESRILSGEIQFAGKDLLALNERKLRAIRGNTIGIVFQDPFSSLNPVFTIGEQIDEIYKAHRGVRDREATLKTLEHVRLPDPERIYNAYPHQISGGQRQRAVIAMAIALKPRLLIADEPTTALDVTVQKEILDLLDDLRAEMKMAMILITHNMGIVAERANRIAVMYAGEIIEMGNAKTILKEPQHPYTKGLLQSLPRLAKTSDGRLPQLTGQPPDLRNVPSGCPFHPRCPEIFAPCAVRVPKLELKKGELVACHLYTEKRF